METSIFVARLLAVVYLSLCVGFLFNRRQFERLIDELRQSATALFFSGLLALVVGFSLIHFHNHWEASWRVVITLFGWIGLFKGLAILILPTSLFDPVLKAKNGLMRWGWIPSLLLGVFFAWFGFFA